MRLLVRARPTSLILAGILCCYMALGVLYGLATPTFEAPDELRHYLYAKQIADGGGLPVQTLGGDNPAVQEASQPPLYYLAAAGITWIDTGPSDQTHKPNPQAAYGVPAASINKNVVVHGPEENFPWQGAVLAVRVIRLFSLLLGCLTVLLTYAVARELLPKRPRIALGAAALNAFIPQFLFISTSVNNDNLVTMFGGLALLCALRLARGDDGWTRVILLGVTVGLAALSKASGLGTLPLASTALLLAAYRRHSLRWLLGSCGLVVGTAIAVAGWWYARNWLLYGDVFGLATMAAVSGVRPANFGPADLMQEHEGLRFSFWAVFGVFNILADRWVYWIYDALTAAAGLGLLLVLARLVSGHLHRSPEDSGDYTTGVWTRWTLALLWIVLLLGGLITWSLSTMASQGRLLFPALATISTLLFFGLASLFPKRAGKPLVAGVAFLTLLAAVAAYLPFAYIIPTYRVPPLAPASAGTYVPNPLRVNYAGRMLLSGYDVERRSAQPGGAVRVTLYWQTLAPVEEDYSVFLHFYAPDGAIGGQVDAYPGGGRYATSRLPAGVLIKDTYDLRLASPLPAGRGQLAAGLYDAKTQQQVPSTDGQGKLLNTAVSLGELRIIPRPEMGLSGVQRLDANLGGQVELVGYKLDSATVAPEGALRGVLYWRPLSRVERDYTVFVHLLGADGLVAQYDAQPLAGAYRTADWRPGDLIADPFVLTLPNVPPGDYWLTAGMYVLAGGQRLRIEQSPPDRLWKRLRPPAGPALRNVVTLGAVYIKSTGR